MIDRLAAEGIELSIVEKAENLVESATMSHFKLAVNTVEHLLICRRCESALGMAFATHLSKKHDVDGRGELTGAMLATVRQELVRANIHTSPPAYPKVPTLRPLIEGVEVVMKVGCSACTYSANKEKAVANHVRECRKKHPSAHVLNPLRVQRVQRCYGLHIRVWAPPRRVSHLVTAFRDFMDQRSETLSKPPKDSRLVSLLLSRTKWHIIFSPYERAKLIEMAAFPGSDDALARLPEGVFNYMILGTDKIDRTERLFLQQLNTPKPAAR